MGVPHSQLLATVLSGDRALSFEVFDVPKL
jgi:hypothetical protein